MKLYDKVRQLLVEEPELRSSDKKLIWRMWESRGLVFQGKIDKESFMKAPSSGSITRARRKIQENDPHLRADKNVERERRLKQAKKGMFVYHERLF